MATPEGWYPDPKTEGQERFWDGATWSEQRRPIQRRPLISSPSDLFIGAFISAAGFTAIAVAVGAVGGLATALLVVWAGSAVAGSFFTAGLIAAGVQIGIRSARNYR